MSEHTKTFIDNLEAGQNADAGEAFKNALRDKMGNALDARRQELAASLFNKTGEGIVDIYADEYGNGLVGAWNRKGKGRTLQPVP